MSEQPVNPLDDAGLSLLLYGGMLCNDAILEEAKEESGSQLWRMVGDPTEGAMVVAGAKAGLWRKEVEEMEIPFDSDRKRMTTIHQIKANNSQERKVAFDTSPVIVFIKGAPDLVLNISDSILEDGKPVALTDETRKEVLAANRSLAQQALRVLGVAYKPWIASLTGAILKALRKG
jgi:Ca2+-transporting ATPase